MGEWDSETVPWVRRAARAAAKGDERVAVCYFCGEKSAILSIGDFGKDNGRVEVYCDNQNCEAREVIVLVERGENAPDRADVRILRGLDTGSKSEDFPEAVVFTFEELASSRKDDEILARRTSTAPVTVAVYGSEREH